MKRSEETKSGTAGTKSKKSRAVYFQQWRQRNRDRLSRERRQHYESDREFREAVRRRSSRGKGRKDVFRLPDSYKERKRIRALGTLREVQSVSDPVLCYTLAELAEVLGFSRVTLLVNYRKGNLPRSVDFVSKIGKGDHRNVLGKPVYPYPTVISMVDYIFRHINGAGFSSFRVWTNPDVIRDIRSI